MQLSYRWVIIGAGALMTCVAVGAMFSLAVFLQPISVATGWSRAGISSAMTLNFLTMAVAGFVWGTASDRFGARFVVLCGGALLGLALVLASQASAVGMAIGPLLGGWVFDTFDAYGWLFLGSGAVGLGAVAVALAFPPLASRHPEQLHSAAPCARRDRVRPALGRAGHRLPNGSGKDGAGDVGAAA